MFVRIPARIDFIFELQQHQMPGLMRTETGHLNIVVQEVGIFRYPVILACEELLLKIEAGTPG